MIFPSEHGLQRCDPFHAPWRNEHGAPAHGNVLGSFAYCPKGHITDLHQDSLFEGRFFTVLFGRKLFLTWPPSAHNLQVYSEIHGSFSGFALPTLLPRLQNLHMTLCTHGAVGYMPPGTIHAVLNIDTAATFAYDVVHSRMLPDITRLCAWEQDVARHLLVSEDHADTVNSIRREHKDGMKLWTNLALVSDSKDVRDA
ncbi:Lysine-specific demethylase 2B, partial [Tilletia horrida]